MATPLFCDSCGDDYPERRGMSAFGILGLEAIFGIETSAIDLLETQLATRLHPDKWLNRGASLHRKALIAHSAVNEALEAVRTPFRRAETLLSLLPDAPESGEGTRPPLPTVFLMEQLDLQEEIEGGLEPNRKRELTKSVRSELKDLGSLLDSEFKLVEKTIDTPERDAALSRIQTTVDRSRYWRNIQHSLRGQVPS
jgi:DnaJ-domain-containing protein 1